MASLAFRTAPADIKLHGRCRCGKVRFVANHLPSLISNCHCKRCRLGTEYPFIAWAKFPAESVEVTTAQDRKDSITLSNSNIGFRESCTSCGVEMFMKYHCQPGDVSIATRTLEEQDRLPEPKEHIFLADKAVWWEPAKLDNLSKWEGFDSHFEKALEDWRASGGVERTDVYGHPVKRGGAP